MPHSIAKKNQQVIYPFKGNLNRKKQPVDICNNMDESQNNYNEWNKSGKREYILYDSFKQNSRKCNLYWQKVDQRLHGKGGGDHR